MPDKEQQKKVRDFLRQHPVGVLATVDPANNPHASVIYFAIDDASSIVFQTKTGTKKADNLAHNPHVMLVVFEAASQTTVQITGAVSEIKDRTEADDVFARMTNVSVETSGNSVTPIAKLKEGDYMAFRLEPDEIRMAEFGKSKAGGYQEVFKTP